MQAGGLQPNHITYTAVLSACARDRQHLLARDVFDRMTAAGVVPDEQAYATLMRAYARAGHAPGATAVVEEMRAAGIKLVRSALRVSCKCIVEGVPPHTTPSPRPNAVYASSRKPVTP